MSEARAWKVSEPEGRTSLSLSLSQLWVRLNVLRWFLASVVLSLSLSLSLILLLRCLRSINKNPP